MAKKKTVLIIDDHPLFREGLKTLLTRHAGFEVIGEAGSGKEGLLGAKELKPDLVVLDISLPDRSGLEVSRNICDSLKSTRVAIVSMHTKIDYISEAFLAGAMGYVAKESASERLLECLETVSKDEYYIDSSLSHSVAESLKNLGDKRTEIRDTGYSTLTPREQQVMRLIAEGLSSREIADRLFISTKTVENHRANIMNKLELHSTIELVRYAAKLGLIDVDLWKG